MIILIRLHPLTLQTLLLKTFCGSKHLWAKNHLWQIKVINGCVQHLSTLVPINKYIQVLFKNGWSHRTLQNRPVTKEVERICLQNSYHNGIIQTSTQIFKSAKIINFYEGNYFVVCVFYSQFDFT